MSVTITHKQKVYLVSCQNVFESERKHKLSLERKLLIYWFKIYSSRIYLLCDIRLHSQVVALDFEEPLK